MFWILGIALAAIAIDGSGSSPPAPLDSAEPAATDPTDSTGGDNLDCDFTDVLDGAELPAGRWDAFAAAHVDVLSPDPADAAGPHDPLAQYVAQVFEQSRARLLSPARSHVPQEHRSRWRRFCDLARGRWQATRAWLHRHARKIVDLVCELLANQRAQPDRDRTTDTLRLIQTVVRLT